MAAANKRGAKRAGRQEALSQLGARPALGELMFLQDRLVAEPGYEYFGKWKPDDARFEREVRAAAEGSLYFHGKFIMGMVDMVEHLHGRVARWLQDGTHGKAKLLMLPFGHLKTSVCTHSQSVHFLIQSAERNIYIPGMAGNEGRYLFACESEPKAKENLAFVRAQLERNQWIRWLWPHVCWENPKTESPRWGEFAIEVPRSKISGEPTLTAIGRGTGVYQRHYEAMWLDDIIGDKDAESVIEMESAKRWRRGLITRGYIPTDHWEFGIGTHFGNDDVYVEWKKELPPENVLCVGALEDGTPIWPERYTVAKLAEIRRRTGDIKFSLGYMNRAVSATFSALDWEALRQFTLEQGERGMEICYKETGKDEALGRRQENFAGLMALRRGDPVSLAYPGRRGRENLPNWDSGFVKFMVEKYPERFERMTPGVREAMAKRYPEEFKAAERARKEQGR